MGGLSGKDQHLLREVEALPAGFLTPILQEETAPASSNPLVVHVAIEFTDPIIRSHYCLSYASSQYFLPTDTVCESLLRYIGHYCEQLISRKDPRALDSGHEGTGTPKRQRFEITCRLVRNGNRWAEQTFRSYQKQPLTVNFTKQVVLALHKMFEPFVRTGAESSSPSLRDTVRGEGHGPEMVTSAKSESPLPSPMPRSPFVEDPEKFESVPGYTIGVTFRCRSREPDHARFEKIFEITSGQYAPLNLSLAEELLWDTSACIERSLTAEEQQFNENHRSFGALGGATVFPRLDDNAVCIDLLITNNVGLSFGHLHRKFGSKLALFDASGSGNPLDFLENLTSQLEHDRDAIDDRVSLMSDSEVRLLELASSDWSIREPVAAGADSYVSGIRPSITTVVERGNAAGLGAATHDIFASEERPWEGGILPKRAPTVKPPRQFFLVGRPVAQSHALEDKQQGTRANVTPLKGFETHPGEQSSPGRLTNAADAIHFEGEAASSSQVPLVAEAYPLAATPSSEIQSAAAATNPPLEERETHEVPAVEKPLEAAEDVPPEDAPLEERETYEVPATEEPVAEDLPSEVIYAKEALPESTCVEELDKPGSSPLSTAEFFVAATKLSGTESAAAATDAPLEEQEIHEVPAMEELLEVAEDVPPENTPAEAALPESTGIEEVDGPKSAPLSIAEYHVALTQLSGTQPAAEATDAPLEGRETHEVPAIEEPLEAAEDVPPEDKYAENALLESTGVREADGPESAPLSNAQLGVPVQEPEAPPEEAAVPATASNLELDSPTQLSSDTNNARERPQSPARDSDSGSLKATDEPEEFGTPVTERERETELPIVDDFARSRIDVVEALDDTVFEDTADDGHEHVQDSGLPHASDDKEPQEYTTAPSTSGLSYGSDSSPRFSILMTPTMMRTHALVNDDILAVSGLEYAKQRAHSQPGDSAAPDDKEAAFHVHDSDKEPSSPVDVIHITAKDTTIPNQHTGEAMSCDDSRSELPAAYAGNNSQLVADGSSEDAESDAVIDDKEVCDYHYDVEVEVLEASMVELPSSPPLVSTVDTSTPPETASSEDAKADDIIDNKEACNYDAELEVQEASMIELPSSPPLESIVDTCTQPDTADLSSIDEAAFDIGARVMDESILVVSKQSEADNFEAAGDMSLAYETSILSPAVVHLPASPELLATEADAIPDDISLDDSLETSAAEDDDSEGVTLPTLRPSPRILSLAGSQILVTTLDADVSVADEEQNSETENETTDELVTARESSLVSETTSLNPANIQLPPSPKIRADEVHMIPGDDASNKTLDAPSNVDQEVKTYAELLRAVAKASDEIIQPPSSPHRASVVDVLTPADDAGVEDEDGAAFDTGSFMAEQDNRFGDEERQADLIEAAAESTEPELVEVPPSPEIQASESDLQLEDVATTERDEERQVTAENTESELAKLPPSSETHESKPELQREDIATIERDEERQADQAEAAAENIEPELVELPLSPEIQAEEPDLQPEDLAVPERLGTPIAEGEADFSNVEESQETAAPSNKAPFSDVAPSAPEPSLEQTSTAVEIAELDDEDESAYETESSVNHELFRFNEQEHDEVEEQEQEAIEEPERAAMAGLVSSSGVPDPVPVPLPSPPEIPAIEEGLGGEDVAVSENVAALEAKQEFEDLQAAPSDTCVQSHCLVAQTELVDLLEEGLPSPESAAIEGGLEDEDVVATEEVAVSEVIAVNEDVAALEPKQEPEDLQAAPSYTRVEPPNAVAHPELVVLQEEVSPSPEIGASPETGASPEIAPIEGGLESEDIAASEDVAPLEVEQVSEDLQAMPSDAPVESPDIVAHPELYVPPEEVQPSTEIAAIERGLEVEDVAVSKKVSSLEAKQESEDLQAAPPDTRVESPGAVAQPELVDLPEEASPIDLDAHLSESEPNWSPTTSNDNGQAVLQDLGSDKLITATGIDLENHHPENMPVSGDLDTEALEAHASDLPTLFAPAISNWLRVSDPILPQPSESVEHRHPYDAESTAAIDEYAAGADADDNLAEEQETGELALPSAPTAPHPKAREIPDPFDQLPSRKNSVSLDDQAQDLPSHPPEQTAASPPHTPRRLTFPIPTPFSIRTSPFSPTLSPSHPSSPVQSHYSFESSRSSFDISISGSSRPASISPTRDSVDTIAPLPQDEDATPPRPEREYRPSTAGWLGFHEAKPSRRFSMPLQHAWDPAGSERGSSRPGTAVSSAAASTVRYTSYRREGPRKRPVLGTPDRPRPMTSGALETVRAEEDGHGRDGRGRVGSKFVMLFAGMGFASKVLGGEGQQRG